MRRINLSIRTIVFSFLLSGFILPKLVNAEIKTDYSIERCKAYWISTPGGETIENNELPKTFRYYRKEIILDKEVAGGWINSTAQPDYWLYINGKEVIHDLLWGMRGWGTIESADISGLFKKGKNVISLKTGTKVSADTNNGYTLALVECKIYFKDGSDLDIISDRNWLWSEKADKNWTKPGYDTKNWKEVNQEGIAYENPRQNYSNYTHLPYLGPLKIEHSYGELNIFDEGKDNYLYIKLAKDFYKITDYLLTYKIYNTLDDMMVKDGKLESVLKGNELVFKLSIKDLKQGPYIVTLDLTRQRGQKLTSRWYEFIITGKISQKLVEGKNLEEGLDLELADEIKCNDKDDEHTFYDGSNGDSKIINSPLGEYRVTGKHTTWKWTDVTSFISYGYTLRRANKPHLLVVEYPDDDYRVVSINVTDRGYASTWATRPGSGFITGGVYPLTNKMQKHKFIFWSRKTEGTIEITSLTPDGRAAVSNIKFYEITNDLPALKINSPKERLIGAYQEDVGMIIHNFYPFDNLRFLMNSYPRARSSFLWYRDWYASVSNFIKYLKFTGQNVYFGDLYQYTCPYFPSQKYRYPDPNHLSQVETDYVGLMLSMFAQNDISFIAGIEFNSTDRLSSKNISDEEVANGNPTLKHVSNTGQQGVYNINCPEVQDEILDLIEEIVNIYKTYPALKGVSLFNFGGSFGLLGGHGFDDYTISLFQEDTGLKIPGGSDDPDRFRKRYEWIRENCRDQWIQWDCEQYRKFFVKIKDKILDIRPDLKLIVIDRCLSFYQDLDGLNYLAKDSYYYRLKACNGLDPELYKNIDGLNIAKTSYISPDIGSKDGWYNMYNGEGKWIRKLHKFNYEPDIIKLYQNRSESVEHQHMIFIEYHLVVPPNQWTWYFDMYGAHQDKMFAAPHLIPSYLNGSERFALSMSGLSPYIIFQGFCHHTNFIGHEEGTRRFAKVYRTIPKGNFDEIIVQGIGQDEGVVVKESVIDGNKYMFIVNKLWWGIKVELDLEGTGGDITDLTRDKKVQLIKVSDITDRYQIIQDLEPYEIKSFRVEGSRIKIISGKIKSSDTGDMPTAAGLKYIDTKLKELKKSLEYFEKLIKDKKGLFDKYKVVIDAYDKEINEIERDYKSGKYYKVWTGINDNYQMVLLNKEYIEIKRRSEQDKETGLLNLMAESELTEKKFKVNAITKIGIENDKKLMRVLIVNESDKKGKIKCDVTQSPEYISLKNRQQVSSKPLYDNICLDYDIMSISAGTGDLKMEVKMENQAEVLELIQESNIAECADISNISKFSFDGDVSDWENSPIKPIKINSPHQVKSGIAKWNGEQDCSGIFWLGWDNSSIYIAAKIKDDILRQNNVDNIWCGDCLEFFFDLNPLEDIFNPIYSNDDWQILITPAIDEIKEPIIVAFGSPPHTRQKLAGLTATSKIINGGYSMELKIPISNFGKIELKQGKIIGFDVTIDDSEGKEVDTYGKVLPEKCLFWNGEGQNYDNPSKFGTLVFIK